MRTLIPHAIAVSLCFALGGVFLGGCSGSSTEHESRISAAEHRYFVATKNAGQNYRHDLADIIANESGLVVEVVLLDQAIEPKETGVTSPFVSNENWFPIAPYGTSAKVEKSITLSAEQWEKLRPILTTAIGKENPGTGAMCHDPIHGIRIIWKSPRFTDGSYNSRVIFESTFCYQCQNFGMKYPTGSGWVGLPDDGKLQKALCELMPLPSTKQK